MKLLLHLGLAILATAAAPAQIVDRMVAVVNKRVILESELDQAVRVEMLMAGTPLAKRTHKDTIAALDRLIDRSLLDQQIANMSMVDPTPQEIADQVKSVRAQLPNAATEEGWKASLSAYGLTTQDIEDYVASEIRILRFVDVRFRGLVRIDKNAINTYYQDKFLPDLRRQGRPEQPLAEVSSEIEKVLIDQSINDMLNSWLQTLRSQAHIKKMASFPEDAGTGQ